ncbi:MAG: hypothetical protein MUF23_04730 [Pirellula sp.]|nr:hypothetical protein [Pirellula sp.]
MIQSALFCLAMSLSCWTCCVAQDRVAIEFGASHATVYASDSVPFSKIRWLVTALTKKPNINSFDSFQISVLEPAFPKKDTPWLQIEWGENDEIHIKATGSLRASYLSAIQAALADQEESQRRGLRVTIIDLKDESIKETPKSK